MKINWKLSILAGLEMSASMPVVTLARHWAYGLVLVPFIPVLTQNVAPRASAVAIPAR